MKILIVAFAFLALSSCGKDPVPPGPTPTPNPDKVFAYSGKWLDVSGEALTVSKDRAEIAFELTVRDLEK